VPAFLHARPVGLARLTAAAVGGGSIDLGRDLLSRVLLGLRLPGHGVECGSLLPNDCPPFLLNGLDFGEEEGDLE